MDHSVRWFQAKGPEKTNGVALAIHGLNLRPGKMGAMISLLTASGIEVLNLSLRGHGQNYDHQIHLRPDNARMAAFKTVSYPVWAKEAQSACHHAEKRSNQLNVPLFLVGFSFGALLGADLFVTWDDVHFDKMVLFAPAFNCTIHYGLKWLAPFPRLVIPSFALRSYRANRGTPMAAYNALFDAISHFKRHVGPILNVPTVIFIDKRDELVSYRGLARLVAVEKLDRWKFHFLQKGKTGVQERRHHLIIDAASLGKEGWDDVRDSMTKHLLST